MKEFVYGTTSQFETLDRELSAGKYYQFKNRQLPKTCTPDKACLWFSKTNGLYKVQIDNGVSTTSDDVGFKEFLKRSEVRFACLDDMIEFFSSLKPLFTEETKSADVHVTSTIMDRKGSTQSDKIDLVDTQKLQEYRQTKKAPKEVMPSEIADRLNEKVFGHKEAIDKLSKKIVSWHLQGNKRKVLVASILGPNGVGKSETAVSLATVLSELYDIPYGTIQVATNQMEAEYCVNRFFGSPPGYVGYGQPTIFENVRTNPNQVIVLDEIEKAHPNVLIGLMEAFDKGYLEMADNSDPINLNSCIILLTSNLPVDMVKYRTLSGFEQSEYCRDTLTQHTGKPEISGRIQCYLVYDSLDEKSMCKIITGCAKKHMENYQMVLVHIDHILMSELIDLALRSRYGVRAARNIINDLLDQCVFDNNRIYNLRGKKVVLSGTLSNVELSVA